jgi:tetratricopeptide (TPR) repeat protein
VKAAARSAHREAVGHFEQALAALRHLPESRDRRERAFDLHLELRSALQSLGEYERMLQHLREAETLAAALADHRRVGQVSAAMANHRWARGDYESAVQSAQQALAAARDDPITGLQATFRLGHAYHALGNYHDAASCFRSCIQATAGNLPREQLGLTGLVVVTARGWLTMSLAELGQFTEAAAWAEEALRLGEAGDNAFSLILACLGAGRLYVTAGDPDRAISTLERGLALCEAREIPLWWTSLASDLGYAHALSGRTTRALPLLEQSIEPTVIASFVAYQALRVCRLAEGYWLARRMADAVAAAQQALILAVQHKERASEGWTLRLLGEIAAHADPPDVDRAEAYYQQALALAEEQRMRPLAAHCRLGRGTLYQRLGCEDQAQAELTSAAESYRAMEMTSWRQKAEAALAQLAR